MEFFNSIRLVGYVRRTSTGDLVVDACKTDGEHLEAPATPLMVEGKIDERRRCRHFVEKVIRPEWLGKKGRLVVYAEFDPED